MMKIVRAAFLILVMSPLFVSCRGGFIRLIVDASSAICDVLFENAWEFPDTQPIATIAQCPGTSSGATVTGPITVDIIPASGVCYYRYNQVVVTTPAIFTLKPETLTGNPDLYLGLLNDITAGDIRYDLCDHDVPGGGWIRCSRNLGSTPDQINTGQGTIPEMQAGDFRIIAIVNRSEIPVPFSLEVTFNAERPVQY